MKNNYCVKLYKSGKFYNAFGDDGLVLHELLGYKYLEHRQSVGFPESALDKVLLKLEQEKVAYETYNKDEKINSFKGIKKNYNNILKKSLKSVDVEQRMNRLKKIIDNCTKDEIEAIIEGILNGAFK